MSPSPPPARLIVALDTSTVDEARNLVTQLQDEVNFYKVGLGHCSPEGLRFAQDLVAAGNALFLDLKLFDIPATVTRAVHNLVATIKPTVLTVHGDPMVVAAAADATRGTATRLLAITVLTSVDRPQLDDMLIQDGAVTEIVLERGRRALAAGADGLVASPLEVAQLRALPECAGKLLITPGIRPTESVIADDQRRTATPRMAIRAGADHIVVGRPIVCAAQPWAVARQITEEISKI